MQKYFLGSVGKAEAFKKDPLTNGLTLAFVSKTLTDSGLNISTTKDDIRGGTGAPIQFSFFHDPSVEITLTDIVFNHEYISAQLGANFSNAGDSGNVDYVTDSGEGNAEGEYTLKYNIKPLPFACDVEDKYFIWGTVAGEDDYKPYTLSGDHTKVVGLTNGKKYCFRYLAQSDKSIMAEITSTIIPEELFLVITAPIYAGDACSASKGKAAGHITFEVPRFQLNGAQEFSMNMSSNQTMSLAGIALASDSVECDAMGGKLLRIIEVIDSIDYKQNVVGLIVDEECKEAGDTPSVYAELRDGHLKEGTIAIGDLDITPALGADNTFENNKSYTIKLKGTNVSTTVAIGDGFTVAGVLMEGTDPASTGSITVEPSTCYINTPSIKAVVVPPTGKETVEIASTMVAVAGVSDPTLSIVGKTITVTPPVAGFSGNVTITVTYPTE